VVFAAAAVIAAFGGRLELSATFITLGAVTDGLDGLTCRWLNAATPFGALFDYFADYLCFVVAPWTLMRALVLPENVLQEILIGLPLVTAAMRYARNGLVAVKQTPNVENLPGLGTLFCAFLPVSAVFLDAQGRIGDRWVAVILPVVVAIFSLLMLAPMRYPKLPHLGLMASIAAALMPFVATRILAAILFFSGLLYAVFGPLMGRNPVRTDTSNTA
jgi:phosphatidylserine synthase